MSDMIAMLEWQVAEGIDRCQTFMNEIVKLEDRIDEEEMIWEEKERYYVERITLLEQEIKVLIDRIWLYEKEFYKQ